MLQQPLTNLKRNRATGSAPEASITGVSGQKQRVVSVIAYSDTATTLDIVEGASTVIASFYLEANKNLCENLRGVLTASVSETVKAKINAGTGQVVLITATM